MLVKVGLPFSYVSFQSIWSYLPKESILIWRKRIPIMSLLLWGKYNSQSFRQTPSVSCSCGHVEDWQAFTCRQHRSSLQFCLFTGSLLAPILRSTLQRSTHCLLHKQSRSLWRIEHCCSVCLLDGRRQAAVCREHEGHFHLILMKRESPLFIRREQNFVSSVLFDSLEAKSNTFPDSCLVRDGRAGLKEDWSSQFCLSWPGTEVQPPRQGHVSSRFQSRFCQTAKQHLLPQAQLCAKCC